MSVENHLISKILADRDLTALADAGVTPAFFKNHEHREAYKFILEHQREYSQVPSVEAFSRNYPTYRITEPTDPLQYFVDELVEDHLRFVIEDGLVEITDMFDAGADSTELRLAIGAALQKINLTGNSTKTVDITQTGEQRLERYREYAKANGALKGISTGFSMIDYATGGMQGGQLFTFVGPPKAGKSTMLLLSMIAAHMGFYKPLFIGFEMSNEEQEERHDSIRAGLSHKKLRDGRLSGEDFREMEKMSRRLELMPPMLFSADATATSTLSGVFSLVEKYKPDVVYVDGVYMMEDEQGEKKGSSQALTNLSRGFKRGAQNFDIPFAISTQVLQWKMDRKRGVTTGSIGYSSSFGQDSDVLIGVEPTDEDDTNKIKILDGRNVKRLEQYVQWNWETGDFIELEGEEDEEEGEDKF